jgi:hypothetical protein
LDLRHIRYPHLQGRRVVFRVHAVERMHEREVSVADVCDVLASGVTIEEYSRDQPYPSRLIVGWCGARPIHVVVADNEPDNELIVITVYEPDEGLWSHEFKRRSR